MRTSFSIIMLLTVFHSYVLTQGTRHIVVHNTDVRTEIVYGFENFLDIVVEGISCDSFEVYSPELLVERTGRCQIGVVPKQNMPIRISDISRSVNLYCTYGDNVDTVKLALIPPDAPRFWLPSGHTRYMNKLVRVYFKPNRVGKIYRDYSTSVLEFKVQFFRGDSLLYSAQNYSSRFTDADNEMYYKLQNDDLIKITDIVLLTSEGVEIMFDGFDHQLRR